MMDFKDMAVALVRAQGAALTENPLIPPHDPYGDQTPRELVDKLGMAIEVLLDEWPTHGRTHWGDACECDYCDLRRALTRVIG